MGSSGSEWLQGFSEEIAWSHPDYPLLLPLNVARLWITQAERSVLAPILLGLIYQLSLVGLLITSVMFFRGNLQGIIAGIIGFVLGQALGNLIGLDFFLIGPLHVAEATIVSWANLFIVQWLKI